MARMYSFFLDAPIEQVWDFIWDFDEWAPLIEGYLNHEYINKDVSRWSFQSEFGPVKKKIDFELEILSWNKPNSITFQVTGMNENFTGHGNLEAKPLRSNRTFVTASIDVQANGPLAKLIKPLLKNNSPKITREFQKEISERIRTYRR